MHPAVTSLAAILRLNTELLLNCLDDLDDEAAQHRGTPTTNNIAFLVTHLIDSRHFMAELLGAPRPSPFSPAIARARCLDDVPELPSLTELADRWEAISAHVAVHVERLDTAQLARAARALPGSDGTLLGNLAFLAQHESYHLGQIALLRRQLGLPAMSYTLRPREPGRLGA
ncbi:MAG TPA: DinB family protein [Gemmatimonadales bacterium]|jgi:uncharacterized damage-inducible protein DinB